MRSDLLVRLLPFAAAYTIAYLASSGARWLGLSTGDLGVQLLFAAVASPAFYHGLAEMAKRHGFLVASDEAYSEIYFGSRPASALETADRSRMAIFNTQSKRSSMTGYRTGSVVGPPELLRGYRLWRPLAGVAIPEFIQRATIVALGREDHVERMRALYAAKRELRQFRRRGNSS